MNAWMRRWVLFFGILYFGVLSAGPAFGAVNFSDVGTKTKYREAILSLAGAGLVQGRPDGTFGVFENLKRAELIQLILKAQKRSLENFSNGCFSDVAEPGQWFFRPVCTAKKYDIARGYKDGTFRPGKTVNRAEAVALLCRIQAWETDAGGSISPYEDMETDAWFFPCVAYAKNNGFLDTVAGGRKFLPGSSMARGAFAEILYRSLLAAGVKFEPIPEESSAPISSVPSSPLQQEMFNLVNQERTKEGLITLVWSGELAAVAKAHSQDMVQRNFFDHVNPDGLSPEDRRQAAGIYTGGGENLSKAPSIIQSHNVLMNSPPHRRNILKPEWDRMGIGIAEDSEGYLLATQLFSKNPLTAADIPALETAIWDRVDTIRRNAGKSALEHDNVLDRVASGWSQRMANEDFFATQSPGGEKFIDILKSRTNYRIFQAFINQSNLLEPLEDFFTNNPTPFSDQRFHHLALGVALDNKGFVKLTVLLTD